MTQRSKSTLFLIEQLIVIAVFAICAAACISILTAAYFFTKDSAAASNAVIKAENAAEIFKATDGDFSAVADVMGGTAVSSEGAGAVVIVYYDSLWQSGGEWGASYVLTLIIGTPHQVQPGYSVVSGDLLVGRVTGEELVSMPVAARVKSGSEVMRDG